MDEDARYLKKKVRGKGVEVHPHEKALVVFYEVEATVLGEQGNEMIGDRKDCQKVIKVNSLGENTNIAELAHQIVNQCHLIHPDQIPEVEQLLYYLQRRKESGQKSAISKKGAISNGISDIAMGELDPHGRNGDQRFGPANIQELDDYLSWLYESEEQIKGATLVLQLARNPDNLGEIFNNEPLVGALARVLREECTKDTNLATTIIYIFFCFSSFSQFHSLVIHFKIGAMCMAVMERELDRYDKLSSEIARRERGDKESKAASRARQKFDLVVTEQNHLLRVSTYLLLNIAEDHLVENKMRLKGIVSLLCRLLTRDNYQLTMLALTFLKKLTLFLENKNEMVRCKLIEKLDRFITAGDEDLPLLVLELLLNLSFDIEAREQIVRCGLLPRIVALLKSEKHRSYVLGVLYHLSMDDKCKSVFSYTEAVSMVMNLLNLKGDVLYPLLALAINLAANRRCAEQMCADGGLRKLMKMAFKKKDKLVIKILRNVSAHDDLKEAFLEYLDVVAEAVKLEPRKTAQSDEEFADLECFSLECIGILANVNVDELDWKMVVDEYELIPWMMEHLTAGAVDDDVLLCSIMLAATMCGDAGCAVLFAKKPLSLIDRLIDLLKQKQEDDEIVCQIVYCFYRLLTCDETRTKVVNSQTPAYLLELMHDSNGEIQRLCSASLDCVAEENDEWAEKIREDKFRWHNAQWLRMVEDSTAASPAAAPPGYYDPDLDDEDIGAYLSHNAQIFDGPEQYYASAGFLDGHVSPELLDDPSELRREMMMSGGVHMGRASGLYSDEEIDIPSHVGGYGEP